MNRRIGLRPRNDQQMKHSENEPASPALGSVDFGDLRRVTPVARNFGFGRGQPVDRYYIERFLAEQSTNVAGRVLEIGDDVYTRRFGGDRVTGSDVLHVSDGVAGATIVADLCSAPHIPSESFDCIICTQTLQLIYDVHAATATLHRILRPNGVLLATMSGISPLDDASWQSSWFWNFTPVSVQRLFSDAFGAQNVSVSAHGNVLTAICFMHGLVTEELLPAELEHDDSSFPFMITASARKRHAGQ